MGQEVIQEATVGCGFGVVELVDDDDVERRVVEGGQCGRMQGLHGGEDVPPALGMLPIHEQFTEVRVGQHFPIRPQRLLQDLLTVRYEQQ